MVAGAWGSGKTYCVNQFFKKYYNFSKTKIYRVSCFGLGTRNEILTEINSVIAGEHNNGYSSVHKVLRFIPVIGDFLAEIFKKNYNISNVKENSIFVFDDFERVTCCGISSRIGTPYGYSHSSYSYAKRRENPDIYNEFDKIKDAFEQGQKETIGLLDYAYMEKYNAIIGLINELLDHYKMKVIIICNIDMLGHQYFNEIFRGKLNCLVYQKKVDSIQLSSVMSRVMDNHIMEDTKKGSDCKILGRRKKQF